MFSSLNPWAAACSWLSLGTLVVMLTVALYGQLEHRTLRQLRGLPRRFWIVSGAFVALIVLAQFNHSQTESLLVGLLCLLVAVGVVPWLVVAGRISMDIGKVFPRMGKPDHG